MKNTSQNTVFALWTGFLLVSMMGCGPVPEALLLNRLDRSVSIDVYGPIESLTGACEIDFRDRFCEEEFVPLSIIELQEAEQRSFTMSDEITENRCTNVLWLRLISVGNVGPVTEVGTLLQLPTQAEVEVGPGYYHTAAFPGVSLRIDEVGTEDLNQGFAPKKCVELGREARR